MYLSIKFPNMDVREKLRQETEDLPDAFVKEVLEFVRLLRTGKSRFETDLESALQRLGADSTEHLEEEFMDYRKVYPVE